MFKLHLKLKAVTQNLITLVSLDQCMLICSFVKSSFASDLLVFSTEFDSYSSWDTKNSRHQWEKIIDMTVSRSFQIDATF